MWAPFFQELNSIINQKNRQVLFMTLLSGRLIKCFILLLFSANSFGQNSLLLAKHKLFKQKEYSFKVYQCTSMKFNDGAIYHVPEIVNIGKDTITISNRGIYADSLKTEISYSIHSLIWINWDGVPRKRISAKYYTFETINLPQIKC